MTRRLAVAFALLSLGACAVGLGAPGTKADRLPVALYDATGARIGTVTLTADTLGLELRFDVFGLPAGPHAVHLHATGACERPDFLSAGPHLDDGAHHHGLDAPGGHHLGDLPDLVVDADGTARVKLHLRPTTGNFRPGIIFDRDGAAVIIHAAPDDGHTDPNGNSGPRIACGIIA